MTALLRYAFLKTAREQLLAGLLLAPTVIFLAPLTGIAIYMAAIGRPFFPFVLHPEFPPPETARIFGEVLLALGALVAAIVAFRVFRSEVAVRGLGCFILASPPPALAAATTLFGTLVGTVAYLIATALLAAVTLTPPQDFAKRLAIAIACAALSAALGALLVGFSIEYSILVVGYLGAVGISVLLLERSTVLALAATLAGAVVLTIVSDFVWRRRCAV